jgi:hypothetical protein
MSDIFAAAMPYDKTFLQQQHNNATAAAIKL